MLKRIPSFREVPSSGYPPKGEFHSLPWTGRDPARGRGIIPPKFGLPFSPRKGDIHILPVYGRQKYGGWTKPYEGALHGMNDIGGLGWSFKKGVKQLTGAGRKAFSSPSKIKKELGHVTKTGLKLMKVALKPTGAKMLAKKGGLKTAISNPDQFIADYNQKLHEKNQTKREAEGQMPPPETQSPLEQEAYRLVDLANASEAKAVSSMNPADMTAAGEAAMAAAKAIRAAGLGEDLAKEWDTAAQDWFKSAQDLIPAESPEGQIKIDDPYTPILPEEPSPTSSQPYGDYYPQEEDFYYGQELYSEEATPIYEEEPQAKAGTEWWYYGAKERPFPTQPQYYEEETGQSDSIIPQADWYREVDSLPSPYSEERYYQQDYPYNGYIPESEEKYVSFPVEDKKPSFKTGYSTPIYERQKYGGWAKKPSGGFYGLGAIPKGQGYYYPVSAKPINPYYAKITKTSKYLPQEIAKLPFPLSRNVSFGKRRNF